MSLKIIILYFNVFSLLFTSSIKSENRDENSENPYKLIDDLEDKSEQELVNEDDDDSNPFHVFKPIKNKIVIEDDDSDTNPFFIFKPLINQVYSKNDNSIKRLWHKDIMKIFYQHIIANEVFQKESELKNYPIDVNFNLKFTEEMWRNLERYLNNSNITKPNTINNYFLNQLKLETVVKEELQEREHFELYRSEYVSIVVTIFILICYSVLSKGKFVMLLVLLVLAHRAWELYNDEMLHKEFISRNIPEHCLVTSMENESIWNRINVWFWHADRQEECARFREEIDREAHHSVNLVKIFTALSMDIVIGISDGIGKIVGTNYTNLSDYLPWYLTPMFLFILFVSPFVFTGFVITRLFKAWLKHHNVITSENDQNYQINTRRIPRRYLQKKITYK